MSGKLSAEKGMSLVEATIILMVLAVLTAVIAPSAGDFVEDARNTKAKEDVEAIGTGILRLLRDTGLPCVSQTPTSSPCTVANRVELLVSGSANDGTNEPAWDGVSAVSVTGLTTAIANDTAVNWAGATGEVPTTHRDLADEHLVTNAQGYTGVSFTSGGGPRVGLGWRGGYLTGPMGLDPWGVIYQASTIFLTVASNATDGQGVGEARGGWRYDVVVISSGSNGTVQTPIGGHSTGEGTSATGDDIVYIVQGSTR